jgi:hypothetical protein
MVVETMLLVVKQRILNQTQGYWLLFNVLNVALLINVCMQYDYPLNFGRGDFELECGGIVGAYDDKS